MEIGRRRQEIRRVTKRALPHMVEALEERRMLAAAVLNYNPPVQTQISTTGAPVIGADVGDLNGDGIPDLVALDGVSEVGLAFTAQPFIGTAKGTFTPGNLAVAGGQTFALGDFTSDGKLDLATPSGVLPGNGDGTFQPAVVGFNNPTGAVNYIAADFNGDGKLDLAVATLTASGQNITIGLDILLGNGDGTFKAPVVTTIKTAPNLNQNDALFFVDDFNADGDLDVLTPFGLFLGNGDGTFKAEPVPLPATPNLINPIFTSGDINDDGKPDILMVSTKSAPGQVELLTGNGDGTFTDGGPITIASGGTISALTAVDLNADGFPEIIAGVQTAASNAEIALLTNSGTGTFGTAQTFAVDGPPVEIFAADMNGDTIPDIISVDSTPGLAVGATTGFDADEVAVLLSQAATTGGTGGTGTGGTGTGTTGTGTTTPPTTTTTGKPPNIALQTSANPVAANTPVTLTVTLTPSTGIVTPTGTVTFSIAGRAIGSASLNKFGKASVTIKHLGLGRQPITATYSGDGTFRSRRDSISELVLSSFSQAPIVNASLTSLGFTAAFVTGDTGHATFGFTETGNATATGTVAIALYLTLNGRIDSAQFHWRFPARPP